jgi:hypothetical protein
MGLDLALAFAAANLPNFPVDVYWDEASKRWRKVPFIRDWEQRASLNPHVIRMWWRQCPSACPGVPPGRINKVVVDADRHPGCVDGVELFHELERAHGPFPPHPIITTKSGGEHHWFSQPETTRIQYAQWKGGEVHGHRRFVVGYAIPCGPIPELPEVFWPKGTHMGSPTSGPVAGDAVTTALTAIGDPIVCESPVTVRKQRYAEQALRNASFELRWCPVGKRNHKLNVLAYNMGPLVGRGWIGRQQVEDVLLLACQKNGLLADDGEEQCRKTLASGMRAGMQRPYHDICER